MSLASSAFDRSPEWIYRATSPWRTMSTQGSGVGMEELGEVVKDDLLWRFCSTHGCKVM